LNNLKQALDLHLEEQQTPEQLVPGIDGVADQLSNRQHRRFWANKI
jgi:predicted RNase H-like HicB family nuclease